MDTPWTKTKFDLYCQWMIGLNFFVCKKKGGQFVVLRISNTSQIPLDRRSTWKITKSYLCFDSCTFPGSNISHKKYYDLWTCHSVILPIIFWHLWNQAHFFSFSFSSLNVTFLLNVIRFLSQLYLCCHFLVNHLVRVLFSLSIRLLCH